MARYEFQITHDARKQAEKLGQRGRARRDGQKEH